jgi:hypothetical protein
MKRSPKNKGPKLSPDRSLNGTAPGHQLTERRRYTQALPVTAKPDEIATMADQMANLQIEKGEVEKEKREHNAEFREKLAGLKDRLDELAKNVKAHTRTEEVECIEMLDEATSEIRVMRVDTGEQIEFRQAKAEDLQETMFDSPKAAKGKKAKASQDEASAP